MLVKRDSSFSIFFNLPVVNTNPTYYLDLNLPNMPKDKYKYELYSILAADKVKHFFFQSTYSQLKVSEYFLWTSQLQELPMGIQS